jgi:serine/threonine protein kinase
MQPVRELIGLREPPSPNDFGMGWKDFSFLKKNTIAVGRWKTCNRSLVYSLGQSIIRATLEQKFENNALDILVVNQEIKITKLLSGHPNVVRVLHSVCFFESNQFVWLQVQELYKETLVEAINRGLFTLSLQRNLGVILQLLNGIEYIHSKGVVLSDIKAENILVRNDNEIAFTDLVGYFCDNCIKRLHTTLEVAPIEIHLNNPASKASNVWSVGLMMGVMRLDGLKPQFPFQACNNDPRRYSASILDFSNKLEQTPWKSLNQEMLLVDEGKRPTAKMALEKAKLIKI